MSAQSAARAAAPDLGERAEALERAAGLARDRLDPEAVDAAVAAATKVRSRLRHGTDRTVVALAGPTGAGKSSLFNAIVGSEVSTPGVKRPTTSVAHAALWGGDEPRLLHWLDVPRRFLVDETAATADGTGAAAGALDGLIVIDLPDVDSVDASNRLEAERLIEVVDALVWVLDPQKYADEVIHAQIGALSAHAAVMRFVVTKIDLVAESERAVLVEDLRRRLREIGIEEPIIWAVSVGPAPLGDAGSDRAAGLAELKDGLVDLVSSQRALAARLDADLRVAASALGDGGPDVSISPQRLRDAALDEVSAAARGDELAEAVAAQYRREARRATGWLPQEWLRRRRPNPAIAVARADNVDRLRIESALRSASDAATADVGAPWDRIVRREVMGRSDNVADALRSRAVNVARHVGRAPRWWALGSWLQRMLLAAAAIGVVWLAAVAVAGGLGLDTEPLMIRVGPTPIPSALVIGGLGIGIIFGLVARIPAKIGGKRRARAARREMRAETSSVLDREVVQPIEHILADRAEIDRLVGIAAGSDQRTGRR